MMNMKTDYKTRQEMAQQLREATVKYINDGAITWLRKSPQPDLEMWDTTVSDSDDLICIAGMIDGRTDESYSESNYRSIKRPVNTKGWTASASKDIEQAFMAACDLDTLVRDVIPRTVWNWMAKVRQTERQTEEA
jgi:predicted membrane-bound spermidine synthase